MRYCETCGTMIGERSRRCAPCYHRARRDGRSTCSIDGCDAPYHARGYCKRHYNEADRRLRKRSPSTSPVTFKHVTGFENQQYIRCSRAYRPSGGGPPTIVCRRRTHALSDMHRWQAITRGPDGRRVAGYGHYRADAVMAVWSALERG